MSFEFFYAANQPAFSPPLLDPPSSMLESAYGDNEDWASIRNLDFADGSQEESEPILDGQQTSSEPGHTRQSFRPFLVSELDLSDLHPHGQAPDGVRVWRGQDSVITGGFRYIHNGSGMYISDSGWNFGSSQPVPDPDWNEVPPPLECQDETLMSPEGLLDYNISEEAARIAREILSQPDRDIREYGALIYIGDDGVVRHTPLVPGGPTSVQPSVEGLRDWGQVVGLVHSHTAAGWDAANPDFRLFPTPNAAGPNGQGDWATFDAMVQLIWESLNRDYSLTSQEISSQTTLFRQYVLGPTGPVGSDMYRLVAYDTYNRDSNTLGQMVNINLGLCNG